MTNIEAANTSWKCNKFVMQSTKIDVKRKKYHNPIMKQPSEKVTLKSTNLNILRLRATSIWDG